MQNEYEIKKEKKEYDYEMQNNDLKRWKMNMATMFVG